MSYFRQFRTFLKDMVKNRRLFWDLAKSDFKAKYLGSYLGIIWAFVQPTVMILVFWFVFQVGFKSMPVDNFPFILWLLCGMIPWFFFSEGLSNATNAVIENSFLVKKVVFRVSILPLIKITSALFIHLFFILFLFAMFMAYGYKPGLHYIQVVYYLIATIMLLTGLAWITSALIVFLRDIGQLIGVILQIGFWITPIFWPLEIVPQKYQLLLKLNPFYYIVEGYRNTFIYSKWFWESPLLTAYFWVVTGTLLILGAVIFKRLRPHFADVL